MIRARRLALALAAVVLVAIAIPSAPRARAATTGNAGGGAGGPALEEVEVVGKAAAHGHVGAEKAAEDDALKAAVEKVAIDLLGGEKKAADKKETLASRILKTARRYVPEFRITEHTRAGSTVLLRVKAKVAVDLLRADLIGVGLLAADTPVRVMTRVVVLPAPSKAGAAPWWAQGGTPNAPEPLTYVLVDALRAKGFQVTEPRRPEPDPQASETPTPAPSPDMGRDNLLQVARAYDVDVLVRVSWETQTTTRALDGISYALARAKVGPVEAVSVKDGTVIATVQGQGQAARPFDPLRTSAPSTEAMAEISDNALREAASDAATRLTAALGDPVAKAGGSANVKLVVAGLDTYVAYARFEQSLQHEVKSIRSAVLSSIERGEAVYDVGLDRGTDAAGLADELAKKDFSDFTVKVTDKSDDRIVVHVGH